MIALTTAILLTTLAGPVNLPASHQMSSRHASACHSISCGKRPKIAKSRLFLLPSSNRDADEYDDDEDDEITVQSRPKIRPNKSKELNLDIDEETAYRLSMVKWIVLLRLAKSDLHIT